MIIYIIGVSCVGKTTIGKMLAKQLGFKFYDLDLEVQKYYNKSIEKLQNESYSMNGFREKASIVLDNLFINTENSVIAGTPSGLKYSYWNVYKKRKKENEIISIHIHDSHENILNRLSFYDVDSNPIEVKMDNTEKKRYLKEIKADYNFFKDSYKRSDLQIDIKNICLNKIPELIITELKRLIMD